MARPPLRTIWLSEITSPVSIRRGMDKMTALDELREHLGVVPLGPIRDDGTVTRLLCRAWPELAGHDAHSTTADKLAKRIEALEWKAPCLMFQIERHGGTVLGSTRADLHEWTVNVETGTATCTEGRYRLVGERQSPLDVRPLVESIISAIEQGLSHPCVKVLPGEMIRVSVSSLIPDSGPRQTVAERRSRFRRLLERRLGECGWVVAEGRAAYTYRKATSRRAD